MSFVVYLDESGITDPSACLVAGYGASLRSWSDFSNRWLKVMDAYGVKEFHAQPFFKKRRLGLERRDADGFLEKLLQVIAATRPVLIGTSVSVPDFLTLSDAKRKYLTGGQLSVKTGKVSGGASKSPFHVAMQNTVIQAAKLAPKGEKAHFICDEQDRYRAYLVERFRQIKKRHPRLPLGGISHASSQKFPPLQAADLACYAAFQFTKERLETGNLEPSGLLSRLITERSRFDLLDRSLLEKLADAAEQRPLDQRLTATS
jgi:hypothetical protein